MSLLWRHHRKKHFLVAKALLPYSVTTDMLSKRSKPARASRIHICCPSSSAASWSRSKLRSAISSTVAKLAIQTKLSAASA